MTETTHRRKPIGKKTRFEVFKRDGFACQYCGSTPPAVILHVDHIVPVAGGGGNEIDNLLTSCEACNLGKGAVSLTDIPKTLKDKAAELAEREDQLKAYNEVLHARSRRIEEQAWKVAAVLEGVESVDSYNRKNLLSIKQFLERLPFMQVVEAAEITCAKWNYMGGGAFRYFCAICWNKIRDLENGKG